MEANDRVDHTFFCCIEAGPLENGVILLSESLRRNGGCFSKCPILAIRPRSGVPLRKSTLNRLKELDVEFLDCRPKSKFSWFSFMNKLKAFQIASNHANTDYLVWMDSDTLVLREPTSLFLRDSVQVSACCTDKNIGTSGPSDPNESFWEEVARLYQLNLQTFPLVTSSVTGEKIRLYWNSGVVVFERASGLADMYNAAAEKFLTEGVPHPEAGIFYTDQVSLVAAVLQNNLKWETLPHSHNFTMRPEISAQNKTELKDATIIHYRGSLWPEKHKEFLSLIQKHQPNDFEWVLQTPPLECPIPLPWKVVKKIQTTYRKFIMNRFLRSRSQSPVKTLPPNRYISTK